jgi:signal transduction histidine kinase
MWQALATHLLLLPTYLLLTIYYLLFDYSYGYVGCLFAVCVSSLTIFVVHYAINFTLTFYLTVTGFMLAVFMVSYGDGGIWSFYIIAYVAVLWWAFYFNQRVGFFFVILLCLWFIFWSVLEQNGFEFPDAFPSEYRYTYRVIYIVCALAMYIFLFWLAHKNEHRIRIKLEESQEQIVRQEKMVSLGKLTAGIAHEINNPINFIQGNAKALSRDFKDLQELLHELADSDPENAREKLQLLQAKYKALGGEELLTEMEQLLTSMQRGTTRIQRIVAGLKNFSYESRKGFRDEKIEEILDASIAILNNKIREANIEIQLDIQSSHIINCEVNKITQVFVNIIDNAIAAIKRDGLIQISSHKDQKYLILEFKDNGIGMEKTTQQRMFDPFFTTKEIGEGTGLGMSISYGIIKDHGGDITVSSTPGQGTTVNVKMPL